MRQGLLLEPLLVGLIVVALAAVYIARHPDPATRARFLRLLGFWLVAAIAGFFGLFLVGETFSDPGGWAAVGLTAAWAVPLAACCLVVWWRPAWGAWLVSVLSAAVLAGDLWIAVDPSAFRDVEERTGPVQAVVTLALAAAVALLGRWRTRTAGVLLLLLGAGAALTARGAVGGGAAMVIVVGPLIVAGALYLVSAAVGARAPTGGPGAGGSGGEGVEDRAEVLGEPPGAESKAG